MSGPAKIEMLVMCRTAGVEDGPAPPGAPGVPELVIRGIVSGVFRAGEGVGVLDQTVFVQVSGLKHGEKAKLRCRCINGNGSEIIDEEVEPKVPPHGVVAVYFVLAIQGPAPPGIEAQIFLNGKPLTSRTWPVL